MKLGSLYLVTGFAHHWVIQSKLSEYMWVSGHFSPAAFEYFATLTPQEDFTSEWNLLKQRNWFIKCCRSATEMSRILPIFLLSEKRHECILAWKHFPFHLPHAVPPWLTKCICQNRWYEMIELNDVNVFQLYFWLLGGKNVLGWYLIWTVCTDFHWGTGYSDRVQLLMCSFKSLPHKIGG